MFTTFNIHQIISILFLLIVVASIIISCMIGKEELTWKLFIVFAVSALVVFFYNFIRETATWR